MPKRNQDSNPLGKFAQRITSYIIKILVVYVIYLILLGNKLKQKRGMGILGADQTATIFKTKQEANPRCPFEPLVLEQDVRSILYSNRAVPKYETRKNKYLFPHLMQGMNGQIRGLREAVYLAIKLDRTLVLPPYYNDVWDDDAEGDKDRLDKRLLWDEDCGRAERANDPDCQKQSAQDDDDYFLYANWEDDDFSTGLNWRDEFFEPSDTILPFSSIIDIELQN